MNPSALVDMAREAVLLTLLLASPVLVVGLVVAAVMGVLQAATQVQEYTLSLVPKILAMLAAAALLGGWMGDRLVAFAVRMFSQLP